MTSTRATPWALAVAAQLLLSGCLRTPDRHAQSSLDVNRNPAAVFELEGKPFCFQGTNNYYLIYKPRMMVDAVLESAKAMRLPVVRTWGFMERGSLDGSVPDITGEPGKEGVYFHYWDTKAGKPAYNDGPDGLERLDYVIHKADQLGLKLIVVLTNNWRDFGGMDQYVTWYGLNKHHEFYSDPRIKEAYKNWVEHVVNRKNTLTGRLYKEEPAVFAWELANEPRTVSGRNFDSKQGWTNSIITDWAAEMSAFIKSLDANHMVSVGDEGFLNGDGRHWTYKINDAVDHNSLIAIPSVDFGTFHMYPEDWGTPPGWADDWILDHLEVARQVNKPTILEEYGIKIKRDQNDVLIEGQAERETIYTRWNEIVLRRGGAAAMFWMLSDVQPDGTLYKDYDKFTIYRGRESAPLIEKIAQRFAEAAPACQAANRFVGLRGASPFVRVARPNESEFVASLGGTP